LKVVAIPEPLIVPDVIVHDIGRQETQGVVCTKERTFKSIILIAWKGM